MTAPSAPPDPQPASEPWLMSRGQLGQLITHLGALGYRVLGPRLQGDALAYETITGIEDLPEGVGDEQSPGRYRLRSRGDSALFGYASTTQSFKRLYHRPREVLLQIRRGPSGMRAETVLPPTEKLALIGARGCDLAGLGMLDRVMGSAHANDAHYAARRADTVVIAVSCSAPAATCFCTSVGTGPRVEAGFDIELVELAEPASHRFVARSGSARGRQLLAEVGCGVCPEGDRAAAEAQLEAARRAITRQLDTENLPERLGSHPEDPQWASLAERCLACSGCTQVCPTCFCSNIEDTTSVEGETATRTRTWDSCFTSQLSYLHGGSVRGSVKSRYRQWLTHKLAHWVDQFGASGCVGCGRCLTWCPVGIDWLQAAGAIGRPRPTQEAQ